MPNELRAAGMAGVGLWRQARNGIDKVQMPQRFWTDPGLDLISLDPMLTYLARLGYTDFESEAIVIEGIPVQFLPTTNALSEEAYQEARTENFDGVPTRVVQVEHLMATMLELGRAKDRIRLALCLEESDYDEARLSSIIKRHGLWSQWLQWVENQKRGPTP